MNRPHAVANGDTEMAFRQAMAEAGIEYHGPIDADGEIHRFRVDGDRKGSLNGWYVLHSDGIPAGEFGSWKLMFSQKWCAKSENTMSDADRAEIAAVRAADKAKREAESAARKKEAADQAGIIWEAATDCSSHPYLVRKQVASFGLRVGRWTRINEDGEIWLDVPDALLVPMRIGKKIVSMQAILPSKENSIHRDKDFLPKGEKRGSYFAIGKPASADPIVVVCEGYATGASIHMATGYPVLVAFDAGNLLQVAKSARKNIPGVTLIIAADNDRWTIEPIENPGVHFAKAAGEAAQAWVAVPQFTSLEGRPSDFNDLHVREGLEAVAKQLAAAMNPDIHDDVPETINVDPPACEVDIPANNNVPATQSPRSRPDFITPLVHMSGNGKPLSTIENLMEICRRLRVTVRYNVISKEIEILIPNEGFSMDNQANASLAWLSSACARFKMPLGQLGDFLCYLADRNPYNPVAEWITSRPWDGIQRLNQLVSTIRAEGEEDDLRLGFIKEAMMKRWMLSAVAASFEPNGVSAHGVLVLQGEQYLGKTAWFKSLVPSHLGLIQDGMMLRPDDRDSVKQAVSYWMVELGELDATFRKSDIAQLKAFITRDRDVLRRAYAKLESNYARRTVFFASVNPRQFLHDPTGNRRYWTISCSEINHQHGLDMQQVWAEIYQTMYLAGERWYLTPDEMGALNEHNKDFEVLDPIKERMQTRYDWDAIPGSWRWLTATEVMLELGFDKPSRADVTQCGQLILEMNGRRWKKSNGKKLSLVPPKSAAY